MNYFDCLRGKDTFSITSSAMLILSWTHDDLTEVYSTPTLYLDLICLNLSIAFRNSFENLFFFLKCH